MTSEKEYVEINGNVYKVKVMEYSSQRKVVVYEENSPYSLIRDIRVQEELSWLDKLRGKEREPYPSRSEHVADAINKAVSKKENKQEKKEEMRQDMRASLEAAQEVWEDE